MIQLSCSYQELILASSFPRPFLKASNRNALVRKQQRVIETLGEFTGQ